MTDISIRCRTHLIRDGAKLSLETASKGRCYILNHLSGNARNALRAFIEEAVRHSDTGSDFKIILSSIIVAVVKSGFTHGETSKRYTTQMQQVQLMETILRKNPRVQQVFADKGLGATK